MNYYSKLPQMNSLHRVDECYDLVEAQNCEMDVYCEELVVSPEYHFESVSKDEKEVNPLTNIHILPEWMSEEKSRVANTIVLVVSLLLIVIAFGLSAAGLLSPSWQVVDIREFRAEHHHGLWLDCTRAERHLAVLHGFSDGQPLHCTYKFDRSASQVIDENMEDIDLNSAAGESEHHQLFGWHKAVLIFMILSLLFAAFALCSGLCAPCNAGCSVIYSILVFLALFFGAIGDAIFFFAAHRVDNRFVQGLVGTYEQTIGIAFYLHGSGTTLFLFAFIVSVIASYQLLQRGQQRPGLPLRELAPLYGSRIRETVA